MTPLVVRGMCGLGDNIYQRAVVRELAKRADVYLETPWPQLVRDLPIKCVRLTTRLRTQEKNAARSPASVWYVPPATATKMRIHYAGRQGTMLEALCEAAGVSAQRLLFDGPQFAPKRRREPYVVIRPATLRTEWPSSSRNPRPEYLALAADRLRHHFRVVSVADLVPGAEWPVLPLPYADKALHAGELGVEELLALIAGASAVVGGVGWIVPAAVAYRVPLFLIYGGQGVGNGSARIFDPRMDTSLVTQAIPDRFCSCASATHDCDKTISGIEGKLDTWITRLLVREQAALAA